MEKSSNKLVDLSVAFAVEILNLVKYLKEQRETIISNQIGRAGTSIGANIHEAQYAHGKADFISKLQIALKEANETSYWLLLLSKTNYICKPFMVYSYTIMVYCFVKSKTKKSIFLSIYRFFASCKV